MRGGGDFGFVWISRTEGDLRHASQNCPETLIIAGANLNEILIIARARDIYVGIIGICHYQSQVSFYGPFTPTFFST